MQDPCLSPVLGCLAKIELPTVYIFILEGRFFLFKLTLVMRYSFYVNHIVNAVRKIFFLCKYTLREKYSS